jgi:hypothetical protein
MTSTESQVTVGLSEGTHAVLKQMSDAGLFKEMRDGFRFGMAFAAATGRIAAQDVRLSRTFLNVGSLDPDGSIRDALTELYPGEEAPYRVAERLAEAGVAYIGDRFRQGTLRFDEIFPA